MKKSTLTSQIFPVFMVGTCSYLFKWCPAAVQPIFNSFSLNSHSSLQLHVYQNSSLCAYELFRPSFIQTGSMLIQRYYYNADLVLLTLRVGQRALGILLNSHDLIVHFLVWWKNLMKNFAWNGEPPTNIWCLCNQHLYVSNHIWSWIVWIFSWGWANNKAN